MPDAAGLFHGRRAVSIENRELRVTVLVEGGHLAEVRHKRTGISPLWVPNWQSVEPSAFDASLHADYGGGVDAKLLAGIMGHNWCLDIFGGPSADEAAAGLTPHGEASIAPYDIDANASRLSMEAVLPLAQLRIGRRLELIDSTIHVSESVENLSAFDRPIAWTQHVTLGPPFLLKGVTQFRACATRSKVFESTFGAADYLVAGAEFEWPNAPGLDGGTEDLRLLTNRAVSSAYTAHLMNPAETHAFFVAFSPTSTLAFGYVWKQSEFPWMGIWEENHSRTMKPWSGAALTRGMEFGVSPMPESRRQMIDRGALFGVPAYRWLPAHRTIAADYWIRAWCASEIPETLPWPG
jgi:hypothetical protein